MHKCRQVTDEGRPALSFWNGTQKTFEGMPTLTTHTDWPLLTMKALNGATPGAMDLTYVMIMCMHIFELYIHN